MFGSELMDMIGAGSSLLAGTVSPDGEPRATRAWASRVVDADIHRLRVIMDADDEVSVRNLATGRFALTGANVRTLRSVQLKGRVVLVEPVTPEDTDLMAAQTGAFVRAINEVDGIPVALAERLLSAEVIAVEFDVEEMFDQSPGPDAGVAVRS